MVGGHPSYVTAEAVAREAGVMVSAVHVAAYVAAALLLLHVASVTWRRRAERPAASVSLVAIAAGGAWWSLADAVIATGVGGPASGIAATSTFPAIGVRSEERRVGKECRS